MTKVLLIFLLGLGILAGAIILNVVASRFGLMSWFEFVKNPGGVDVFSYIWLFVLYPFGLGVVAYFIVKYLKF